ncbi:MAG TPA: DUF4336 domain-containing protein [Acidisphaera sp.]|nr:DUF4336 domain-containing protein [Acidisphaera sp.]
MAELEPVAENIWAVSAPFDFLGAIHLGTRMTVVRLSDGSVLLHSPVPISDALAAEIAAIGPVRHIVCPNRFHHTYAGQALARFPGALLHGPRSLWKKRKDLTFAAELTETPHPDWAGDLELLTIKGCALDETVFYHPATRTLIASDLVENFHGSSHRPTDWYLKAQGLHGRIGWRRLMRFVYRDRKAARASLDRLLQWPFERVVVAHGDIIRQDAREAVRDGMAWV